MAREFTYTALPMRVVFGVGSLARVPDEVTEHGLRRVLVVCSPGRQATARQVAEALGERAVGVLPEARSHVPGDVAQRAGSMAADLRADGCVAVGGGSAIGLGKALALAHGLPVVAIPTTYAGSEMTPIWGRTEEGIKRTGRDPRVLPVSVVYDPTLTLGLPTQTSVTSGFNAIAHAVEALYAPDISPIIALMAEEGVRAVTTALPAVVADGSDLDARAEMQYGAWLCGAVLGATTMSLHHRLCHALGGTLDLPHAATHTVVLPHVLAYNAPAAPAAVAVLRRALGGVSDPPAALRTLADRLGAVGSLHELGMVEEDVPRIASQTVATPYANPRHVTLHELEALLRRAWAGAAPLTV